MDPLVTILLTLGPALLQTLFGGSNQGTSQQQTTTSTSLPSGYQSPMLGMYDMLTGGLLSQQVKRTSNFGYPAGAGMDTSWIDQLLSTLGTEWPKLLAGAKGTTATPNRSAGTIRG